MAIDTTTLGIRIPLRPEPPDEADTVWISAGPTRIGVEYRHLDPDTLAATYGKDFEFISENVADRLEDEGLSIHVRDGDNKHEYLRFDLLDGGEHYHYIPRILEDEPYNYYVVYDTAALGEMLPWVIERLRKRLPNMLRHAGAEDLATTCERFDLTEAIEEIERLAKAAVMHQSAAQ